MSGETDLATLLRSMIPVLHPELYVFARTNEAEQARRSSARMIFHEAEATTLILAQSEAERAEDAMAALESMSAVQSETAQAFLG